MKSIHKKIFYTLILSVICVIAFVTATLTANRLIFADKVRSRDIKKLEAIDRMMDDLSSSLSYTDQKAIDQYEVNAVLTAKAISNIISEEGDSAITTYRSGAVVKIENGQVTAPAYVNQDLGLSASLFEDEKGVFAAPASPSTLVAYSRIGESAYYYLELYEDTVLEELAEKTVNLHEILEETEAAYGSRILLVKKEDASEAGITVLYGNEEFLAGNRSDRTGLTWEQIAQSAGQDPQSLELDGTTYRYSVGEIPSLNGHAVLLVPETDIIRRSVDQVVGLANMLVLLLAGLVASGLSLYTFMLRYARTTGNEKRYEPAFIRKAAAVYGIVGFLFIGISSAYIYSLNGMYEASENGMDALGMLEKRIALNISRASYGVQSSIDSYIDHGDHISEILAHYPQLRAVTPLQELADCIGASSITLYDHTGKEIVSSDGYIDMKLGSAPGSTTYDFRRILKGIPYIVHNAETDETTGQTGVRIGVRMDDFDAQGKYGVMLISLDPAMMEQATAEEISSTLRYMSEEDTMLWVAESGSGIILASSNDGMTGRDIYSLGMGEYDLKEDLMKSVYLENGRYFVLSSLLDDPIITKGAERFGNSVAYYAVSRKATNYGVFNTVANCCVVFLIIYAFLAWFILKDYTEEFYIECKNRKAFISEETDDAYGTEADDSEVLSAADSSAAGSESTAGAAVRGTKTGLLARIWRHLFGEDSYWGTRRPEQRGIIVTELFIALFLLQHLPVLSRNGIGHDSLYYYIIAGNWDRGINLFSFARIMILAGEMMLSVLLLNILLGILGRQIGAKGETVCRLIINVIKYLSLATFVGMALYYLGMDKTTLLAALSILSLAISLGSQSLVADIIAGISIILEGVFDVGDHVVIGQHTGRVLEIGVRTTRILCSGNDVLIIGNKEIQTVLNKSKRSTEFDVTFSIRSDYPVDILREMLDRELPGIAAKNDLIIKGPVFEGITKIGDGKMTISIATVCRQSDLHKTKLFVNSELQKIFAKNGIRL